MGVVIWAAVITTFHIEPSHNSLYSYSLYSTSFRCYDLNPSCGLTLGMVPQITPSPEVVYHQSRGSITTYLSDIHSDIYPTKTLKRTAILSITHGSPQPKARFTLTLTQPTLKQPRPNLDLDYTPAYLVLCCRLDVMLLLEEGCRERIVGGVC